MEKTLIRTSRRLCLRIIFLIILSTLTNTLAAQGTRSISGIVVDDTGLAIPGANIIIEGTTNGTISDGEGKFQLAVPASSVLEVSFIGYITEKVPVTIQDVYEIMLMTDAQTLSEVVVVGYGVQKKETITGSVAAVGNEEIVTTKSANVQNMLAGKIAGVKITQKTSEPGRFDTNDIQIRGMGAPLVIIDGVPRDNFERLDPNDIESMSVLKDAAAAIYGVRAANGVILITTKKGKAGEKFSLEYTGYVGVQHMINQPQAMDAVEFMTIQNEKNMNAYRFDGSSSYVYSQDQINAYLSGELTSTPWEGTTLRNNAMQTQHSFSASGGTDKVNYYANFGYLDQQGFFNSGDLNYERFNLRSNVSAEIAEGLRVDVLLNGSMDERNSPSQWSVWNLFKGYWTQIPINPMYWDEDEEYPFNAADGLHPDYFTDADESGYQQSITKTFNATMSLEWEVPWIQGLKAKGMYSYDYNETLNKNWSKQFMMYSAYDEVTGEATESPSRESSQLTRQWYGYENTQLQLSLNYARSFGKHDVSALVLYEESTNSADNFYATRDFSFDAIDQLFAGNSTNQIGSMYSSDLYIYTNKALVGRFNYDYDSKYLTELSFRYDGSSKFAADNRWGFFPAASVGWRMTQESFIKDASISNVLSDFKLRASYGLMGDDSASSYQYLTGYDYPSGGYVFGDEYVNAMGIRGMANTNITWITAAMLNLGVDFELWRGLLSGTFEVYRRDRSDLLATRAASLPGVIGATLPEENINSDMTHGFEIALSHRNRIGDFSYNISGNISYSRTKWKYVETSSYGNSYENWRNNSNDRWNDIWWGVDYVGRFESYDDIENIGVIYDSAGNSKLLPGDLVYEDWNGDGMIDGNDYHPVGYNTALDKSSTNGGMPMINYGFSLGGEWRGFDLNMVFQGAAMSYLSYPEQLQSPLPWNRNGLSIFMDRWQRVDPYDMDSDWIAGYYPSTYADNDRSSFITGISSQFWMENASYLRLKSLEIGYTLPQNVINSIGIDRLRIFFNAYNLFTITNVQYVDPEHTGDEYGYTYPQSQNFNLGVNITF